MTAKDYIRFNQNVCTYSYSYAWWGVDRWEYEIDWMALNGINLAYAHTGAEYAWVKVLADFGLSDEDVSEFLPGPAYLAWFRMGNLKRFGGPMPFNWHINQGDLQAWIVHRYQELGIRYALPAFAGFVPDRFRDLYPQKNFTNASDWIGFDCKFSCLLMVDPTDELFQKIGKAFNTEIVRLYGVSDFFSADVFNELTPSSTDLDYLAQVNKAVYDSIASVNPNAVWVMQAWLFLDEFWIPERVQAFLSLVPIGRLLLLDLYSEARPLYQNYASYYGHYFVWNFLHDFGGANGLFGDIQSINVGPDVARAYPNSSMVGIGLTMEGINQNEMLYEFMLEKSFQPTLEWWDVGSWVQNFTVRRYTRPQSTPVYIDLRSIWYRIVNVLYDKRERQIKQFFAKRPNFNNNPPNVTNVEEFYNAWDDLVGQADLYRNSTLFKYDLVDLSKEALRFLFNDKYLELRDSWQAQDLYSFNERGAELIDILNDMDRLLATDEHFLLSKWLRSAKSFGINEDERDLYEWNARTQITLWGANSTASVFDYACKAWSGLIADYYIPRWSVFIDEVKKDIIEGKQIDPVRLNEKMLLKVELPFISSKKVYPDGTSGDSFDLVKIIHSKYRYTKSDFLRNK